MHNLKVLHLHNNKLFSTIPPEIGQILNVSSLSISYNNIKGTIPAEIGNLSRLRLLHLHSNRLEGIADHFDYEIESFITDCGNTETTESLVDCVNCTECCNEDMECIREDTTWPRYILKKWHVSKSTTSAIGVFVFMLVWWCFMIFIAWIAQAFKHKLPKSHYLYGDKGFQCESVYRFFLASTKSGKSTAILNLV